MTQDINEGNKAIQIFDGWEIKSVPLGGSKRLYECYCKGNQKIRVAFFYPKYHSSWDWLMPVVDKIHSIVNNGHKVTNKEAWLWCNIMDALVAVNISLSYSHIVEYINWYNEQSNTKQT